MKLSLEQFLATDPCEWNPEGTRGLTTDPEPFIREWATRSEEPGGHLPLASARAFSRWLSDAWADWAEEEQATVPEILEGAVSEWCGGRSF